MGRRYEVGIRRGGIANCWELGDGYIGLMGWVLLEKWEVRFGGVFSIGVTVDEPLFRLLDR